MSTIHPLRYLIHITPDMEQFIFKGQVTIELEASAATDTIDLNLLELAIWRCRLRQAEGWRDLSFALDPAKEALSIRLPQAQSGRIELRIDYQGIINNQMAGFYRSQAVIDGRTFHMAVTQFQESSARQAFPCLDHPLHKALFDLTLTVPKALTVIANTLPIEETAVDETHKKVVFGTTPKMSTYLLFFGVGPFERVQDNQDRRVRLAHLPGQSHTTALGLEFGRKALAFCEAYYGIDYPLPKMDLIAVPDFAFGAMENWGAITFRENLLLHFPGLTSQSGVQRICEVIAHEIAHQWFGNLVTPSDWKYLWLNESFATYFGFGVVAHYHPDWGIWDQFLHTETATALVRDGLRDTIAIEIPGGEHVVINSSTAPIIYNKGGSILRMIQGFIGTDAYQQGVRGYLRQHQYACAQSRHLWEAFEAASAQPISAMMQNWIGQPGHPLVEVARHGDRLQLNQKRFTYLAHASTQTWEIPLTLTAWTADGQPHAQALMMQGPSAQVDLPPTTQAYKINTQQTGFYRVAYLDAANLEALGRRIQDQSLAAEDRWGIQNDLYALARQGTIGLDAYLDYLNYYLHESAFLPLISISGHLFQAMLSVAEAKRAAVIAKGRALAGQALARIGLRPRADEPQTTAILREQLLWQGALWGVAAATGFSVEQFHQLTAGQSVHPDIAKAVMQTGAWTQGRPALEFLCQRFTQSPSEHERMNILAAFGAFQDWELTQEALAFCLEKVPPRNRFMPIVAVSANPTAQAQLWTWYQSNLDRLETFHPLLYERVITAIVPYGGLGREEEVHRFAAAYTQKHPNLTDAMRLALEHLEINARMRR